MNLNLVTLLVIGCVSLFTLARGERAPASIMEQTVQGMIDRLTPNLQDKIIISIPEVKEPDFFEISQPEDGKIKIEASDGVAAASGYHYYLREYLHAAIGWIEFNLDNARKVDTLPKLAQTIRKDRFKKWTYYMNQTVASYTTPWWTWKDWEKHIDFMATRGINMPLMFVGQEYIWAKTFMEFKMTLDDLKPFFAGPAFLAWQRMGNIRGWGGPLTVEWMTDQLKLGRQVYDRMRAFGMKPVLPAFAGHVPARFEEVWNPDDITRSDSVLSQFFPESQCCVRFLEPTSPLFTQIGESFIRNLIKYYGPTDHLYNGDLYNEMIPASNDPNYLARVSNLMMDSMMAADPDAIWVLQGWTFYFGKEFWGQKEIAAHLDPVPDDRMIVLDLYSENRPMYWETDSFSKKPFVWCELLNFGANTVMNGRMPMVMWQPFATASQVDTMVGIGATLEGLFTNEIMFDLMFDHAWMNAPEGLDTWTKRYIRARYGAHNEEVFTGWTAIYETAYSMGDLILGKARIVERPWIGRSVALYNHCHFLDGWELLLKGHKQFHDVKTYQYDVVDITRQALSNLFDDWFDELRDAYLDKDACRIQAMRPKMLQLITDLDEMLGTHEYWMAGKWIADAERAASSQDELELFRKNAKFIITIWDPKGILRDYSARQWSGVMADYYRPRWEIFFDQMLIDVQAKRELQYAPLYARYDASDYAWPNNNKHYPSFPKGHSVDVAMKMFDKYIVSARTSCMNYQIDKD